MCIRGYKIFLCIITSFLLMSILVGCNRSNEMDVKSQNEVFYEILCDAYFLGKVNGKEFAISSENGYGKGVFALYDIDGDGFDELLLNLTDDSEQRTYAYIWGYNNGNTYVELCGGPLMNYYNNGIIEDGWSYKNELSGDFYPYSVYRYNEETDTYQSFGSVDAWDKKVSEIKKSATDGQWLLSIF